MSGRYDFDRVVDRRGTDCLKYDGGTKYGGREDLLPMWVADMDFPLPGEILDRVQKRVAHGIFGYTDPGEHYGEVLENWFLRRYGWEIDRTWNTVTPGIVFAIYAAVCALTEPGDAVLIQEPVYYPFRSVTEDTGRVCASSPLTEKDGRYAVDFADFEEQIVSRNVKAFILCSPHNPVGRVWTEEELRRMGEICLRHGVCVIADEIHCDFIYPGHRFVPYGSLGAEFRDHAVICTAPSKTFNMAGLQISNILVSNPALRKKFRHQVHATGCGLCNAVGLVCAEAVYEEGDVWLDELREYLRGNLDVLRSFLAEQIPEIRLIEPDGTYLIWIDFSGLFSDAKELSRFIRDEAHLWLDDGTMFGESGSLFERFNIACPRSVLEKALRQLADAAERLRRGRA